MEAYRWHEQDSFRNLYESEISILERGLDGDFELIKSPEESNGRVVVLGTLKFDDNKEQSLQITFPTKYPSSSPTVIAVNIQKDGNGHVAGVSPHHFGRGNQYRDGSLCLLRKEEWNRKEHNIGWVLRRAQSWLESATSEGGFKPHEVVHEAPAYMKHFGQVLLPFDFNFPDNAQSGKMILTQFKPNYYILEQNILQNSIFELKNQRESFKWYKFEKGITFKNLFPTSNANSLPQVLNKHFGVSFSQNSISSVGIFLPDDPNPWHFFKAVINQLGQLQFQYLISRNINRELYLRTKGIFDDKILKKKRVTIIGLGAIGSEVCKSLARNGTGHFNLFDNDIFEIGNTVRHAADLFHIGESKVEVARKLIFKSNPNITVSAYPIDILNDNGHLEQSLSNSDLCIVLTAEDSVDYMINDIYVPAFEIPFIFARVSPGGFSGSIQVVQNGKTPCLRCISAQEADILPEPKGGVKFDELPPEYGDCSSPALPGSEIDTKEVALQVSRIALQELLKNEDSIYPDSMGKQYYWHGPMGSAEKDPFTWDIKNQEKHPDCFICQLPK